MKNVIIAGANSFVASHFVYELLVQDYQVTALVRGNDSESSAQRMQSSLEDTQLDRSRCSGKLTVVDYRLLEEHFGIEDDTLEKIFSGDIEFFHFAASLKFDYHSKEEIFETNIDGLQNALRTFKGFASTESRFFFISTAYSCGRFSGVFQEKFYPDEPVEAFRNYYEQSKRRAENVIQRFMEIYELNGHIIRLSQVVGDSRTGVTRTDYGIFDFAKRIYALSQEYPNQSVRIRVDPDANQNLISIDMVVSDLITLLEKKRVPVIMNFVADNPTKNHKIIQSINELLPIELIPEKELQEDDMKDLEKMVLSGMRFTGNYIDIDIPFDTIQRDKVISSSHRNVNNSDVFGMLAYFLDHLNFRKTVKDESLSEG